MQRVAIDALGLNPDRNLVDALPAEVSEAVNFGRPVQDHTDGV